MWVLSTAPRGWCVPSLGHQHFVAFSPDRISCAIDLSRSGPQHISFLYVGCQQRTAPPQKPKSSTVSLDLLLGSIHGLACHELTNEAAQPFATPPKATRLASSSSVRPPGPLGGGGKNATLSLFRCLDAVCRVDEGRTRIEPAPPPWDRNMGSSAGPWPWGQRMTAAGAEPPPPSSSPLLLLLSSLS